MGPSGAPHLSISVTCQAPTMKRNQRKSAVEVKDLREQMGHLGGRCFSSRSGVGPFGAGRWSQFCLDDLQGEGLEFGE